MPFTRDGPSSWLTNEENQPQTTTPPRLESQLAPDPEPPAPPCRLSAHRKTHLRAGVFVSSVKTAQDPGTVTGPQWPLLVHPGSGKLQLLFFISFSMKVKIMLEV